MSQDRRNFLASTLAAAPLFVPRTAWGANDRLTYGLIGAGGRGRYLQGNFQKLGAECVAIAEVYEPNLNNALKATPGAKTHVDYHELLRQPGIDAVVIATEWPEFKKLDLERVRKALTHRANWCDFF
jgi:hypothetical protein